MTAAALMSSMGATAKDADSFDVKYDVSEQITIQIFETEVALTSTDVSSDDGYARGSTAFCVGRQGADVNSNNGNFTVTVTSDNDYTLIGDGGPALPYELHHTVGDAGFETGEELDTNADQIQGTTNLNVTECDNAQSGTGFMWVSIPPSSIDLADTGEYKDRVYMIVAP